MIGHCALLFGVVAFTMMIYPVEYLYRKRKMELSK